MRKPVLAMLGAVMSIALIVGLTPLMAFAAEGDLAAGETAETLLQTQEDEKYVIVEGTWGTCRWTISTTDSGWLLTVHPGEAPQSSSSVVAPWAKYSNMITGIVFSSEGGQKVVASNCDSLFAGYKTVESIDLSGLDTSQAKSMISMFSGCTALRQINITGLNTSNVTNMSSMFDECPALESVSFAGLDTSKVINTSRMFSGCTALKSIDLSTFNTANVKDMSWMFSYCPSLGQLDVSKFNTSKVTDMSSMFYGCSSLKEIDVTGFDTSQVTSMGSMFSGCSSVTALDVTRFNTSQVANMGSMFASCSSLAALNVSGFDTSKVTNMRSMFSGCSLLTALDVSHFDTAQVTDMAAMFSGCTKVTELDVSKFNTANVTDMSYMFSGCAAITKLDVTDWQTSKVKNMSYMFSGCSSLKDVDTSGFDTSGLENKEGAFDGCDELDNPSLPDPPKKKSDLATYAGFARTLGFTDLDYNAWYMTVGEGLGSFSGTDTLYLDYTLKLGLMTGYRNDDGTFTRFGPTDMIERAQAATILYRIEHPGSTETTDPANYATANTTGLGDVETGTYYTAAVNWAQSTGVITGYKDDATGAYYAFGPHDFVTREQLATMISRYCENVKGVEDAGNALDFPDAGSVSTWAKEGVAFCAANSIVSGFSDGSGFHPQDNAQRCQMAKIVAVTARMLEEPV